MKRLVDEDVLVSDPLAFTPSADLEGVDCFGEEAFGLLGCEVVDFVDLAVLDFGVEGVVGCGEEYFAFKN